MHLSITTHMSSTVSILQGKGILSHTTNKRRRIRERMYMKEHNPRWKGEELVSGRLKPRDSDFFRIRISWIIGSSKRPGWTLVGHNSLIIIIFGAVQPLRMRTQDDWISEDEKRGKKFLIEGRGEMEHGTLSQNEFVAPAKAQLLRATSQNNWPRIAFVPRNLFSIPLQVCGMEVIPARSLLATSNLW